jgi:heme A synthase
MTAKEHNKLVGILFLALGGLNLIAGIVVAVFYIGLGYFAVNNVNDEFDQTLGGFFIIIGVVGSILLFVFSLIDFIAGWKMFKEKANARTWGIVASILLLLSIPFGTASGIYGLWFLFGKQGKQFHEVNDLNRDMFHPPQPPPSNWA